MATLMGKLEGLSEAIEKLHSHTSSAEKKKRASDAASVTSPVVLVNKDDGGGDSDEKVKRPAHHHTDNEGDNEKKIVNEGERRDSASAVLKQSRKLNTTDRAGSVDAVDISGVVLRNKTMVGSKILLEKSNSLCKKNVLRNSSSPPPQPPSPPSPPVSYDVVVVTSNDSPNCDILIDSDIDCSDSANTSIFKSKSKSKHRKNDDIEMSSCQVQDSCSVDGLKPLDDNSLDTSRTNLKTRVSVEREKGSGTHTAFSEEKHHRHSKGHHNKQGDVKRTSNEHSKRYDVPSTSTADDSTKGVVKSLPRLEKTLKDETDLHHFQTRQISTDPNRLKNKTQAKNVSQNRRQPISVESDLDNKKGFAKEEDNSNSLAQRGQSSKPPALPARSVRLAHPSAHPSV